jgi:vacuolar-type H+-ATPase subunit H
MEHIDLINRIIEAEYAAQTIADKARDQLNALPDELKEKSQDLRDGLFERANNRIEKVREEESRITAQAIAKDKEENEKSLVAMVALYEEHKTDWSNKLFELVINW